MADQVEERRLTFAGFTLDLASGSLSSASGEARLRPKSALVLSYMIRNGGRAIGKAELLDAVWPDVTVTEDSLTQCIHEIREGLGSAGQELLRTLPRRGYLFTRAQEKGSNEQPDVERAVSSAPSIAVLPFVNLSGNPKYDVFADGLAEDVITRLSRLRWLFVVARNSSFAYRHKAVTAAQIGADLGVRYVLTASVQHSGRRFRINAQLNNAETGFQIWAERYDAARTDFLSLQDRISESVIAAIEPKIYTEEHRHFISRPPASLDAWGFVMQAMPNVWTWASAAEIDAAEDLLRKAVEIDPDYARANSLLAWTHAARFQLGLADTGVLSAAHTMALRAIRRDPEDAWAHFASGYVFMVGRQFDEAVTALREAIALNPSLGFAHIILGSAHAYNGLPEPGLRHLAIAARMSPKDHTQAPNLATVGLCHFMAKRYGQAVDFEKQAVALRPSFGTAWRTMAAAAGMANDRPAAELALRQARRLQPSLSIEWVEKFHPIVSQSDRAVYIEGLRCAGLR